MTFKNNYFKYIFSIDTKSTNRVVIYFCGIKIRFLKPGIKKNAETYYTHNCPPKDIPHATGDLRMVQLANLKVASIFKELCDNNKLQYWLDHGSLLGAVRHEGFIPWDDDIDIGMPRDDYEKFINLYLNNIPDHSDINLQFCNNGRNKCFLKLKHKSFTNIGIDIFPYDFYYKPVNDEEKLEIANNIRKFFNKNWLKFRLLQPIYIHSHKLIRKRFKNIFKNNVLKNNSVCVEKKPALIYGIDYPMYNRVEVPVYDYDTIFPTKKLKFEHTEFNCPNNPDIILKRSYGNYMELPEDCYARHSNPQYIIQTPGFEEFVNTGRTETD